MKQRATNELVILHCVRFKEEADLCNYVRQRNIRTDDIRNIVYNQSKNYMCCFTGYNKNFT